MNGGGGGDGLAGGRLPGRGRELHDLAGHVEAAVGGAGRLVVLEGPAGIGKSALLRALRPMAERAGARHQRAHCSELERDYPFGVVRQLLEPAAADAGEGVLSGAAALAASVLGTPSAAEPEADPGFAVLHGLFWLVANLAERAPLVLVVDDVQWADAPSLRFLDHLAMRLDGLPVLVALAARAGDATLTIGPIARLLAQPDVHVLSVDPLGRDAVGDIVRRGLGGASDDLVAAVHEVTGGNAFLVCEVVGELRRSGRGADADPAAIRELAPPAIVRSLRLRLESLPAHAVALARAVAILGDGADLRSAAELAQLRAAVAEDAVDELARADLLAPGRPLRFSHAVVLSAARESMPAAVRSDLHRRAAAMAASREHGDLDAAASHLLAVDPSGDPFAAVVLREAAGLARRRGAADTASTYLRRALAEPPDDLELPNVLVDLAGAAAFAGEPDALVFAERALETATDPAVRLRAAREAALVHLTAGRAEMAADTMASVLGGDSVPVELQVDGEGLLLVAAAFAAKARRRHGKRLRAARELAERLGPDAPASLLVLTAFELVLVDGDVRHGNELLDHALAGGRLLRETTSESPVPYIAGNALIVAGRYSLAEATVDEVIKDAAARGSIRAYALATAQRGLCRLRYGRLRAAEADARAALEVVEGGSVVQTTVAAATLAGVLTETGDLDMAADALDLVPADGRRPGTHLGPVVEEVRARLHAADTRWEEVLVATEACAAWERDFGARHGGWPAWRSLAAEARAELGDRAGALALSDEGVALARAYGVPRTLGIALRVAGELEEDPARRIDLLRDAAGVLVGGSVQAEAARALVGLGAALEAAGRRDDARIAFESGLGTAEAIGARRVEQDARDGLVRLGLRPRRRTASGTQALTAGERRVADLAAQGVPNREIAEQLFLTLKTVENHLTSTYRKLGIASRAQLGDRLG